VTDPLRRPSRLRARQILGLALLGAVLLAAAEIAVAVLVARQIGPWPTLLAIVALSALGLVLVRRGGAQALQGLRQAAVAGRLPGGETTDGVIVLLGGLLLIPPGFILDIAGLLCVLPFTRPLIRLLLGATIGRRVLAVAGRRWRGSTVIRGEVVHRDEPPDGGRA
jgi:UPF0716 protein FxsA